MRAERARALIPSLSKIRASDSPERTVRLCQGDASGTEAIGVTSAAAVELGGRARGGFPAGSWRTAPPLPESSGPSGHRPRARPRGGQGLWLQGHEPGARVGARDCGSPCAAPRRPVLHVARPCPSHSAPRVVRRKYKECADHFPRWRGAPCFPGGVVHFAPSGTKDPLMHVLDEFKWRGLVNQSSLQGEALQTQFASPGQTVYCGFDHRRTAFISAVSFLARPSPIPARGTSSHRPGWRATGSLGIQASSRQWSAA